MKTAIPFRLWSDCTESAPVIYIHSFVGDGEEVWNACHELHCPPFHLVSIHQLDLDSCLSPWPAPGVRKGQPSFQGKADEHLQRILSEVVPAVENELRATPSYHALAGYSLAGLFTLWSAFHTSFFSRLACVSGSLWYPGLLPYLKEHSLTSRPDCFYFSLGDKEKNAKHPLMKQVEECTFQIVEHFQSLQIPCTFEMNAGTHFTEPDHRMAKAIYWILNQ